MLDAQTDGEGVSIGVAGKDSGQCEIMLQAVQDCTAAQKQVQCYMTDADTLDAARESNLPLGKYRMLLTLQELDLQPDSRRCARTVHAGAAANGANAVGNRFDRSDG